MAKVVISRESPSLTDSKFLASAAMHMELPKVSEGCDKLSLDDRHAVNDVVIVWCRAHFGTDVLYDWGCLVLLIICVKKEKHSASVVITKKRQLQVTRRRHCVCQSDLILGSTLALQSSCSKARIQFSGLELLPNISSQARVSAHSFRGRLPRPWLVRMAEHWLFCFKID